jgi:hypothetical protein
MNPFAFLNLLRGLYNITLNPSDKWKAARKELKDDCDRTYKQPFMDGLNGIPDPPKAPRRWYSISLGFVLCVILGWMAVVMLVQIISGR